jgi:tetratricopeptide (TPR) repeat protein
MLVRLLVEVARLQSEDGWDSAEINSLLATAHDHPTLLNDNTLLAHIYCCQSLHHLATQLPDVALNDSLALWQLANNTNQKDKLPVIHLLLGVTLLELGKLRQARTHFLRGLALRSDHFTSELSQYFAFEIGLLLRLGVWVTAKQRGDSAEANKYLDQAIIFAQGRYAG